MQQPPAWASMHAAIRYDGAHAVPCAVMAQVITVIAFIGDDVTAPCARAS